MTYLSIVLALFLVVVIAFPSVAVWANERARALVVYLRERWKREGPKQ